MKTNVSRKCARCERWFDISAFVGRRNPALITKVCTTCRSAINARGHQAARLRTAMKNLYLAASEGAA